MAYFFMPFHVQGHEKLCQKTPDLTPLEDFLIVGQTATMQKNLTRIFL